MPSMRNLPPVEELLNDDFDKKEQPEEVEMLDLELEDLYAF